MLKKIALVGVAVIAGILTFAATKPDSFRVQRSTNVTAPPAKIFGLVNDFHRWNTWSPFEKLDPAMKRTHSGAPSGKGAIYEWSGNSDAGTGRMEILEVAIPNKIVIALDFSEPFVAHNTAEFTFETKSGATEVTWAMYGPSPYLTKVMTIFCSMDQLVGKEFETGLASMKALAEN